MVQNLLLNFFRIFSGIYGPSGAARAALAGPAAFLFSSFLFQPAAKTSTITVKSFFQLDYFTSRAALIEESGPGWGVGVEFYHL